MSNGKILLSALIIVAIIAANAGIFLSKGTKTQQNITPQEEITIRYLSASTIVEPMSLQENLATSKA